MKEKKIKVIVGDYNDFKKDLKNYMPGMKPVLANKSKLIPGPWSVLDAYIQRNLEESESPYLDIVENPINNDDIEIGAEYERNQRMEKYESDKVLSAIQEVKVHKKNKELRDKVLKIWATKKVIAPDMNTHAFFTKYIHEDISYSNFNEWVDKYESAYKKLK